MFAWLYNSYLQKHTKSYRHVKITIAQEGISITRQICSYAWMKNKNSLSIAIRHTKTIETASKVVHVIRTWFTQTNEKENLLRRERKSWSKLCHVNLTCHHILRPCKINPQPPKKPYDVLETLFQFLKIQVSYKSVEECPPPSTFIAEFGLGAIKFNA